MGLGQVIGHDRPLSILRRALTTGRLAHAYLFVGPEGTGKATTAAQFARALQCRAGEGDACEVCKACRKVRHGNHPDVAWVVPEGPQIRIEQIREMQRLLIHRPLEGAWRVIIVDPAHDLTPQSANALLKTLEEPPAGNVLILIARTEASLPPTVVSRCQVLRFSPLSPTEVARYLEEREGWPREDAIHVAIQSRGSVQRALELRDHPMLNQEVLSGMVDFLETLQDLRGSEVLQEAQAWAGARPETILRLECLQALFRDMVLLALGRDGIDHQDLKPRLSDVASGWSFSQLLQGWEWTMGACSGIARNWNVQLVMDHLLLRLHRLRKDRRI